MVRPAGFGTVRGKRSEARRFPRTGERANSRSELVRPAGFEPAAYSSGGCRSIQLSYGRTCVNASRDRFTIDRQQCSRGLHPTRLAEPKLARDMLRAKAGLPGRSSPALCRERRLVRPEGIEPPAYRFEACRSIHLSYGRTFSRESCDECSPPARGETTESVC